MSDALHQSDIMAQVRLVARLEATVEAQAERIDELKDMVEKLTLKVDAIARQMTEARGGWRALMLLGGAAAALGAGAMSVLQYLRGG